MFLCGFQRPLWIRTSTRKRSPAGARNLLQAVHTEKSPILSHENDLQLMLCALILKWICSGDVWIWSFNCRVSYHSFLVDRWLRQIGQKNFHATWLSCSDLNWAEGNFTPLSQNGSLAKFRSRKLPWICCVISAAGFHFRSYCWLVCSCSERTDCGEFPPLRRRVPGPRNMETLFDVQCVVFPKTAMEGQQSQQALFPYWPMWIKKSKKTWMFFAQMKKWIVHIKFAFWPTCESCTRWKQDTEESPRLLVCFHSRVWRWRVMKIRTRIGSVRT